MTNKLETSMSEDQQSLVLPCVQVHAYTHNIYRAGLTSTPYAYVAPTATIRVYSTVDTVRIHRTHGHDSSLKYSRYHDRHYKTSNALSNSPCSSGTRLIIRRLSRTHRVFLPCTYLDTQHPRKTPVQIVHSHTRKANGSCEHVRRTLQVQ